MKKNVLLFFVTVLFSVTGATAQSEIYPQHFNLQDVTLTAGPLKTAMDKNIEMLLQYDVDRLLTPYIRQAGLNTGDYEGWVAAHPSFSNWGSYDFNLDGHVGGHYLTALSLAYAACHDATTKTALKTRLDKMVSVMKDCQDAFDGNTEGLEGFIGGQPMNDAWKRLYSSQDIGLAGTGSCAVPWYCQHKILAGLRDAYVYGGNETARTVFLKLCDWCILVTSTLSDEQMEWMLNTEHGGVNETLLDAYKLTKNAKYLTAAKRFTHKTMLNGLQSLNTTFLDNRHANTQVPKYIGMERIFEEDATATAYQAAAENFWTDVAQNRTVCIGGNSMYEHFLAAGNSAQYINHLDGPESCNTNNMLKLSEMLSDRTHDARYADFYEYAMWNHILSTQDPTTGGYVYFTTLRPQGYRIYSTVNESMWCCVGTGMENHSKYGHFIYTHDGTSTLYVNLFTPSTLSSDDFSITQTTSFPFSDESTLTVGKAGTYTIAIRHPWWTTSGYKIYINDVEQSISVTTGTASYVSLNRTWTAGDVIRVVVPMQLRYTTCPNYTDYIAFQYGPILLAAQSSTDDADEAEEKHLLYEASLQNEYGHEGRMDHAPGSMAKKLSLTSAPLLIGDRDGESGVLTKISTIDRSELTFSIDASREDADSYTWQSLTLQPFYQIHHARYSCYWYQATAEDYANSSMAADEAEAAALADRTLDFVATGEQQSEAGHFTSYENSTTGVYRDEYYRDARPTNGYVQYTLSYQGEPIESGLSVLCRFTNDDHGRKATLYVDGEPIANIMAVSGFNGANESGFYNVEYPIPASLMRDAGGNLKQSFVVRLAADKGTNAPGLYYLRLMKGYTPAALPATITTTAGDVRTVVDGVVTGENGQDEMVHDFAYTVSNTHGIISDKYWRNATTGGTYSYNLSTGGNTEGVSLLVEMFGNDPIRMANIDIDGVTIAVQEINYLRNNYIILEYPIDPVLLQGKTKVNVKFSSIVGSYTLGTNNVYLTTGRTTAARVKTPYTFVNTNFEKNGGTITGMTYNDGAIQITSGGDDYGLNMRMKTSMKDIYSIMPSQYLFTVKGQNLGTNAHLWWMMGCNDGKHDDPTYSLTDNGETYLVWDLRKVATFSDEEKNARFFGVSETPLTTTDPGLYSLLCMGLTSTADDHSATISDINFYSPEELVDKYSVLSSTVNSLKTGLATDSVFAYGDYVYKVTDASTVKLTKMLSTGTSVSNAPSTLFGYNVDNAVAQNLETIMNNHGVATSLVTNTTFDTNADGWSFVNDHESSKTEIDRFYGSSWRGGNNNYVDCNDRWYTISQKLSNMPAGTYKLVAAMRGRTFGIRPSLNGYVNSSIGNNGNGYWYGVNGSETLINKNGVVMPVTDITKNEMNYAYDGGAQWNWVSVTANLATDGDLTIAFKMEANNGCWACLDDVHLYYSENADGFYQITSENNNVPADKVVTCDIVLSNPNTIISSTETITTAADQTLNNNLVSGTVAKLVLYDPYEFSADDDFTATDATLYRSVAANGFATICAPFAISGASGTFYQPKNLDNGTLNFESEGSPAAGKAYLYKAGESTVSSFAGSGTVKAAPVDNGKGVVMKGRYLNMTDVPYNDYVLSGTNLYKVNSKVGLRPFRAYFTVPDGDPSARIALNFDENPTAINAIEVTEDAEGLKDGKYIENGKIVIVKNSVKYGANGQKLG